MSDSQSKLDTILAISRINARAAETLISCSRHSFHNVGQDGMFTNCSFSTIGRNSEVVFEECRAGEAAGVDLGGNASYASNIDNGLRVVDFGFEGGTSYESNIEDVMESDCAGCEGVGFGCGGAVSNESNIDDVIGSDCAGFEGAGFGCGGAISNESKIEDAIGSDCIEAAGFGLGGATSYESKIEYDLAAAGFIWAKGFDFGGGASIVAVFPSW